jgi:mannose-1-phosphate guanylyltransferase
MTEAILLVGGQGTRLRPLTEGTPKPMLPIAGAPITAHQLAKARDAGIDRIVLATSYLAEVFEPYFGNGSAFGVELIYAIEGTPLGTGGAIANAGRYLLSEDDAPVTVFNGDVLSGHDLAAQIQQHIDADADLTLYLTEVADARAYGCVPSDDDGRVTAFLEKMPEPITNRINAGCYIFRRSVIAKIPRDVVVSVERETFPQLLESGANVRAFVDTSYWIDLGTAQALVIGSKDLVLGVVESSAVAPHSGPALISPSAVVDASALIDGGSAIGAGCRIAANARVSGSVLLDDVEVGAGAQIFDSYIGANVRIGAGAGLRGTAIGDGEQIAPAERRLASP